MLKKTEEFLYLRNRGLGDGVGVGFGFRVGVGFGFRVVVVGSRTLLDDDSSFNVELGNGIPVVNEGVGLKKIIS